MTPLSLTSGLIRSGRAVLAGSCADAALDGFLVVVNGTAGKRLQEVPLRDLVVVDEKAGVARSPGAFRAELPLDHFDVPIRGIEVRHASGDHVTVDPAGYQLGRLFLETDAEFDASSVGTKRRARPADKETDCFLSRQLAAYFPGSREYRILMSIAYCYRSTELLSEPDMINALRLLENAGQLLEKVRGDIRNFRKDQTHLHFSRLTARWHAELALGRFDAFRDTLDQMQRDAPRAALSDHTFSISFNLVRSLLVLAIHRGRLSDGAGATEALRVARKSLQWAAHTLREGDQLREFGETCVALSASRPLTKLLSRQGKEPGAAAPSGGITEQDVTGTLIRCIRTSNRADMMRKFFEAA